MEYPDLNGVTANFGFKLTGAWTEADFTILSQASGDFCRAFHWEVPVQQPWLHGLEVRLEQIAYGGLTSRGLVRLNPAGLTVWTVVHELGHALDWSQFSRLSFRLMCATRSYGPWPLLHTLYPLQKQYWYHVGSPSPPCGSDQNFNRLEDFAETVAAYVYPDEAHRRAAQRGYPYEEQGYTHFAQTPRGKFIAALAAAAKKAPTT